MTQRITLNHFEQLPPLTHLKRLTSKTGLIQHADKEVPDPTFGYSLDDNARAMIACLWHYKVFGDRSVLQLADVYFSYIKRVEQKEGTFHNFLTFLETEVENEGSEDSIGRAVWALGEIAGLHPDQASANNAKSMLERTNLDKHLSHAHLRTKAYISLGLAASAKNAELTRWADTLVAAFERTSHDSWQWFEDSLRYANGIFPYALAKAYQNSGNETYLNIAQQSYRWLDSVSRERGVPAPIGQNGWFVEGRSKALYDQQPLEAADMVLAGSELYRITKDRNYLELALDWMNWYWGHNTNELSLINEQTGGIYDALTPDGVNLNQGAESIATFLLAYLSLSKIALSEQ